MISKLINDLKQIDQQFIEDLENGSIFISIEFKSPKDTPQKIKTMINLLSGESAGHKCNKYIIKTTYQKIIDLSNSKLKLINNNLNKILNINLYRLGNRQQILPDIEKVDGITLLLLNSKNYKININKIIDYLKIKSIFTNNDFKLEIDNNGFIRAVYLFINIKKINNSFKIIDDLKEFNFIYSCSINTKFIIPKSE